MSPLPPRLSASRRRFAVAAVLAAAVGAAGLGPVPASAAGEQLVVRQRAALDLGERAGVRAEAGVTLDRRLSLTGVEVVDPVGSAADALAALRSDPSVLWASPLRRVQAADVDAPTDPNFADQWGLENDGRSKGLADADVDALAAWSVSKGAGVVVGVVDSGLQTGHPDLQGQSIPGVNFVSAGGEKPTDTTDLRGHGTHVAGIIAAAVDGIGGAGIAPDAKVQPLRVLDANGVGDDAAVAEAFDYAGDHGLKVVNASLTSLPSTVEEEAIQAHPGTLYVVAAGNESRDTSGMVYPCASALPNVICVGASERGDLAAGFSNSSRTDVDLFAPGDSIISTWPVALSSTPNNPYRAENGTSMAAPFVAGAAALVIAAHPAWTAAQVKAAILDTVDHPLALARLSVTGGRLNAARALGVDVGPDGRAPLPLTGVVAASSEAGVTLSWDASPAADLADYRVDVLGPDEWTTVQTTTGTSVQLPGVPVGGTVTYRVVARDRTGEVSLPVQVDASVPAPPTPTPLPVATPAPTPQPAAPTPAPTIAGPVLTPTPAPTVRAAAALSTLTSARVLTTRGRLTGVSVRLSRPGALTILAVRNRTKTLKARTVRATIALTAGQHHLSLRGGITGLGLTRGLWRIQLSGEAGRTKLLVRLR